MNRIQHRRQVIHRVSHMPLRYFLLLLAVTGLGSSCISKFPISKLHRSDVTYITFGDCASREYVLADEKLIDQFWRALCNAHDAGVDGLRQNTGFAKVWIHQKNTTEPLYFRIVGSIVHGPVIRYNEDRLACDKCEAFFNELKKTYPDFNWCQAPPIE